MDTQQKPATVQYFVHEGIMVHMERINKRLTVLCCIMAAVTAFTIAAAALGWI